tara:strand:- start:308 stop:721 length:414 start_codon:yes stop_codon:yes gene_type:complete
MSISKILNTLEKSWKRDDILLKIKNGLSTDEIVDEFLLSNELQIKKLNSLLRQEDIDLLNQVEQISTCESKLINKIKNINKLENNENQYIINQKNTPSSNRFPTNRISSFLINWSNKVVVISILTISAIALCKQAWA